MFFTGGEKGRIDVHNTDRKRDRASDDRGSEKER